jgi:hypothetical protein
MKLDFDQETLAALLENTQAELTAWIWTMTAVIAFAVVLILIEQRNRYRRKDVMFYVKRDARWGWRR